MLISAGLFLSVACAVDDQQSSDNGVSTQAPSETRAPGDTPVPGVTVAPDATAGPTAVSRPTPDNDVTTPRVTNTPVPEPEALLPNNTLALVMAVRGGSSTGTLKTLVTAPGTGTVTGTASIKLETTSKSVVLYLPDSGDTTVINSYSSPSYAPHFKRPYTVEDRLYVSDKYTNGGAMTISEYATEDFSRSAEWGTQTDALDPGYAVAGGQVYFKTGSTEQWSMSRGFYSVAGDYMTSPFDSRWDASELERPEVGFALVSGGDTLYGARLPSEASPITGVFTVDPDTGQGADTYITAFEVEEFSEYHGASWRNVVIADGIAYWAGFQETGSTATVEILAASLVNSDDFTVYEFDMPNINKEVIGFDSRIDADGGYVLIKPWYEGGDRSKVLIYDTGRETAEVVDTGFHIVDAQVLYIEG